MFNTIRAADLPATNSYSYVIVGNDYYFAQQNKNGRIDAAYLLLAYAFDKRWKYIEVHTRYDVEPKWWTAAQGLIFLAGTLPDGFTTRIWKDKAKKVEPDERSNFFEVTLNGAKPPEGGPLDTGDIFAPNANGFHNIPRLYLMAALVLEEMCKASVAALVVNEKGLVVSLGVKAHGEGGCGHAEVRALLAVKGEVPDRAMLFSTLKPCTMCAGLIRAVFSDNCKQYWARSDPSKGADYSNVVGLGLPNGLASTEATKDSNARMRQIKLQDSRSFTDAFSTSWTGREARLQEAKDGIKKAYQDWCDKVIKPGGVIASSIRVKQGNAAELLNKAKGCGDVNTLSRRSDLFERSQSGTAKTSGLTNADWPLIVDAFNKSSFAKAVERKVKDAKWETDLGIIEYISASPGSNNLRVAARNALSHKFVKYGKSVGDVKGVTDINLAAPTGPAAPSKSDDDRIPKIANYLFDFLKAQRT